MDKPTSDRIAKLHPALRDEVREIVLACDIALNGRAKIRITQGLRTIAEQDALYAQGRSKPGKVVTFARGGYSFHNYGLAVDFCLILDGKEVSWDQRADYDGDQRADWMEVVEVFKRYGWVWGGDFRSIKDSPHFQKTFGYTEAVLYKMVSYEPRQIINEAGTIYPNIRITSK